MMLFLLFTMKRWQHVNGYNHVEGDTGQGLRDYVE